MDGETVVNLLREHAARAPSPLQRDWWIEAADCVEALVRQCEGDHDAPPG